MQLIGGNPGERYILRNRGGREASPNRRELTADKPASTADITIYWPVRGDPADPTMSKAYNLSAIEALSLGTLQLTKIEIPFLSDEVRPQAEDIILVHFNLDIGLGGQEWLPLTFAVPMFDGNEEILKPGEHTGFMVMEGPEGS